MALVEINLNNSNIQLSLKVMITNQGYGNVTGAVLSQNIRSPAVLVASMYVINVD